MKQCKMCTNEIPDNRIYCGNNCKYSDFELNSKRIRKEKNDINKKLQCKLCQWETKDILNCGGHPKKHLNVKHNIISNNYMEYFNILNKEKTSIWICPDCSWESNDINNISGCITTHIKKHYNNISNFFEKYPQYNYLFQKQINSIKKDENMQKDENNIKCELCGKLFYKLTQTHLAKHDLTPNQYKEKYGVHTTCSEKTTKIQSKKSNDPLIKSKMIASLKKTNNEKFGFNSYTQTKEGKDIIQKKTFVNTYNNYIHSKKLNEHVELLFTVDEYLGNINKEYKFLCKKCNKEFYGKLENGRIPRCFSCYPKINKGYSTAEKEISDFIKNEIGIEIKENVKLIGNLEVDIFCESKNIAIEYDGIYWHSELNGKDKDYHLNKTLICENNGIKLIHIFEDEWIHNENIVKSRLKNIFNVSSDKIYARLCEIKEISNIEKKDFFDINHLQGNDNSSIKIGLFYKSMLISAMTFSKSRFDKNFEWEMTRFANKNNFNVIGAFSKLLRYFIKNYIPKSIMTFADRRWSNKNNVYIKNGFELAYDSAPNYWYFNKSPNRQHRFNYRKSVLKNKLKIYDGKLSEWENMQLNGYDRIWDCGSSKYKMILK